MLTSQRFFSLLFALTTAHAAMTQVNSARPDITRIYEEGERLYKVGNYLGSLEYLKKENIPFEMLLPLIQETASRLNEFLPEDVQTGLAIRGDKETMHKHLELLQHYSELKKIYETMSEGISNFYKQRNA